MLALFGHRAARRRAERRPSARSRFSPPRRWSRASSPTGRSPTLDEQFFVDSLNVFLVALTAFVAMTTAIFSRPYMRIERDHGRVTDGGMRLYHSMYQLFMLHHAAGADHQQPRRHVGGDGGGHAHHRAAGGAVPHATRSLEAAWKYFILCGVGIAQALFGTILRLLRGGESPRRRARGSLLWTHLDAVKAPARADRDVDRVRVPADRLRHQGRAWCRCTTGCPTRTPRARRRYPRCSPGCCSTSRCTRWCAARCITDGALERPFASALLMGFGLRRWWSAALFLSRQRDIKRMFAYSSIEHMGLITFAFGMGGPVASFAGPAAHDHALAHQERDLLRRRPRGAEGRHADHGRHPRPDPRQSHGRLGTDAGHGGDPRHAALRRVRERIPDPHHGDARSSPGRRRSCCCRSASRSPRSSARCSRWCSATPTAKRLPHPPALIPVFTHLALVLVLGLYMPPYLADWYREAARLIG